MGISYSLPISLSNHGALEIDPFIARLQRQEAAAFKELVTHHQDRVFNTCMGFLRNQEDAEDIAQEVFIEVYESIGKFRADSKLATWIYRISVTKSLELIRKRKRKKRMAFFQALLGDSETANRVPDPVGHPGVLLENQEKATILFQAIDQLPDNQRVAFTLHKVEGLPYQEIAAVLEVSLSSVESLMHRAKKNLQKKLYQYYQIESH